MKNGRCDGWQPNPSSASRWSCCGAKTRARGNETRHVPLSVGVPSTGSVVETDIPARLDRLRWARFIRVEKW